MDWINNQLWNYAEAEKLLPMLDDNPRGDATRPPVFGKEHADRNILIPPDADAATREKILAVVPQNLRHIWFRNMRSSQALAQSVFANLIVNGDLSSLNDLESDQGLPAFGIDLNHAEIQLEYEVDYLNEPRPTSVDAFILGTRRIAVECKFTESEFGTCSRPRLKPDKDPNYESGFCDGTYTQQRGRTSRCALSELGIQYWQHVPTLFHWQNDHDLDPCPLRAPYQLVRNVLAACVTTEGTVEAETAHALVVYDNRNPSFRESGECRRQFDTVRDALKDPSLLRSCSWQSVVAQLTKSASTSGLVAQLQTKYAF